MVHVRWKLLWNSAHNKLDQSSNGLFWPPYSIYLEHFKQCTLVVTFLSPGVLIRLQIKTRSTSKYSKPLSHVSHYTVTRLPHRKPQMVPPPEQSTRPLNKADRVLSDINLVNVQSIPAYSDSSENLHNRWRVYFLSFDRTPLHLPYWCNSDRCSRGGNINSRDYLRIHLWVKHPL